MNNQRSRAYQLISQSDWLNEGGRAWLSTVSGNGNLHMQGTVVEYQFVMIFIIGGK